MSPDSSISWERCGMCVGVAGRLLKPWVGLQVQRQYYQTTAAHPRVWPVSAAFSFSVERWHGKSGLLKQAGWSSGLAEGSGHGLPLSVASSAGGTVQIPPS